MISYAYINLLHAFANFVLATLAIRYSKKRFLNIIFGVWSLFVGCWSLGIYFHTISITPESAMFWSKALHNAAMFIPPLYLHMIMSYVGIEKRAILKAAYISSLILVGLNFTPLYIAEVSPILSFSFFPKAGSLYFLYILIYGLCVLYSCYQLICSYHSSSQIKKTQIKYILLATTIAYTGGATTFLPVYSIPIFPYGNYFTFLNSAVFAFVIFKYKFMDIELLIKRSFVYTMLIAAIVSSYSMIALVAGLFLGGDISPVVAAIMQGLLIAIGFKPLESYLSQITDRYFYKARYDYRKTINEFSQQLSTIMKLDDLLNMIGQTIVQKMHVANVAIFLKEGTKYQFRSFYSDNKNQHIDVAHIPESHPLIIQSLSSGQGINRNDISSKLENGRLSEKDRKTNLCFIEIFQKLHATLLIPYISKGDLVGFMTIGDKLSEDSFSQEDIQMLETLASQSAISIENSRLYSRSLQKVTELLALYEVGQVVSSGKNLEASLQTILDAVINVIGVDRGIIFLYDKQAQQLVAKAARGREEDWAKIKLEDFRLPINKTIFGKLLKTKQTLIKSKTDSKESTIGNHFLEILEVEAYAAVPLMSNNQTIGILAVDNKVSKTPIEKINMGLLTTLANQAAVAIENTRLYKEIKDQIDELKVLNTELIEIKNYNEDILANMSSGIVVIDDHGRWQTLNRQAEIILGKPTKEVKNKKPEEIWPDDQKFVDQFTSSVRHNKLVLDVKFHQNHHEKFLSITTTSLKDANNKTNGKLAVITDTTELHKLELQVRRSDKLSALGRMAAGVAHEIKNPLTSMRLFVQMMSSQYDTNPNFWASHSDILLNELDRLEKIVGDFVGFAKTPELKIESVSVSEMLEKVMRLVKAQAQESKVVIEADLADTLWVKGDAQRLTQVFLNLILNAIQSMPAGYKDGKIHLKGKAVVSKGIVIISVVDNGCGIPEENIEKLFNPFFTTKDKGTGLGLSIIHKLIEEHKGSIDVESKVGVGTKFTVTLPVSEPVVAKDVQVIAPVIIEQHADAPIVTH